MFCDFVLFLYRLLVKKKKKKIVLEKKCLQRGFEFFENIVFLKKKVEHQKLKGVHKIY